jgi:hypothetical protein
MPTSLDTIREATLTRLQSDATFRTLTGATNADPRLYYRFFGDAVISDTQPVYVTYMLMPHNETAMGVAQPVFSFFLWSRPSGYTALKGVADRIQALFDRQVWTVGSVRVQSRLIRQGDVDEVPGGQFTGRSMHVRVAFMDVG